MENRKLTIRPAVASDLAELKRGQLMTRFLARALHYQLGDRSWALTLEGRPIAAAGIWPGDGIAEAWFLATPALKGKSVLPIALPMIAAALQKLHRPSVPIIAAVAADNRGGRALASRLGFVDAGQHPLYPGCLMFVLVKVQNSRSCAFSACDRRPAIVRRPAGGPAAGRRRSGP